MAVLETPSTFRARLGKKGCEDLVLAALEARRAGAPHLCRAAPVSPRFRSGEPPETVAAIPPWLDAWAVFAGEGAELRTRCRNFSLARGMTIPKELVFDDLAALTRFLGGSHGTALGKLQSFLGRLSTAGLPVPEDRPAWRAIYRADPADLACLFALMRWRHSVVEEDLADTALREIPVAELHTKWVETHAALVLSVFRAVGWAAPAPGSLSTRLGLCDPDRGEIWMRLHPDQCGINGQRRMNGYAPSEFTEAPIGVERVLIVENRTTFDRIPVAPGSCLIFGSGKAILSHAAKMTWLKFMTEVRYWGDCDGAGYFILARLRREIPHVVSILMDLDTVEASRSAWGPETPREAVSGPLPELTRAEAAARNLMHQAGSRLEQESISPKLRDPALEIMGSPATAPTGDSAATGTGYVPGDHSRSCR